MENEEQVQKVVNTLAEIVACPRCETRLRFGDTECPHCGADLEDRLRSWAESVIDALGL